VAPCGPVAPVNAAAPFSPFAPVAPVCPILPCGPVAPVAPVLPDAVVSVVPSAKSIPAEVLSCNWFVASPVVPTVFNLKSPSFKIVLIDILKKILYYI
jgi:hypothetical protein